MLIKIYIYDEPTRRQRLKRMTIHHNLFIFPYFPCIFSYYSSVIPQQERHSNIFLPGYIMNIRFYFIAIPSTILMRCASLSRCNLREPEVVNNRFKGHSGMPSPTSLSSEWCAPKSWCEVRQGRVKPFTDMSRGVWEHRSAANLNC